MSNQDTTILNYKCFKWSAENVTSKHLVYKVQKQCKEPNTELLMTDIRNLPPLGHVKNVVPALLHEQYVRHLKLNLEKVLVIN